MSETFYTIKESDVNRSRHDNLLLPKYVQDIMNAELSQGFVSEKSENM